MRVVCTGPESSGTRLLTQIVAGMGVEAVHRSIPQGNDWEWYQREDYDAAVVIVRDFYPAARSKVTNRHCGDLGTSERELREAIAVIPMLPYRWTLVTFSNLVTRPEKVAEEIAEFLGVEVGPLPEIRDANAKWYAEAR